jgi:hypothetical protein
MAKNVNNKKNKNKGQENKVNSSINLQIQQTIGSQQQQQSIPQPEKRQELLYYKTEEQERLRWKTEKCKAFWIWLSLNVLVAGLLCILVMVLKNCFFGGESFFYVLNKEAYTGYFYALSISLLAQSLSTLFISWLIGQHNNGKIALAIISIVLICAVVGSYVSHSERLVKLNVERDVKNIDIKELVGDKTYDAYEKKGITVDELADSINTEILFDSIVDKEQLKNTLVHVKLNIAEPKVHVNWLLVILTLSSFAVSIITFLVTYPIHPESRNDENSAAPN